MFTGIVEELAVVRSVAAEEPGRRITISSPWQPDGTAVGDSVAVNGVCLTVVCNTDGQLTFQVGPETLVRTNLGGLASGDRVNLERALLATSRLGGHFVQGHVDGFATVAERLRQADWDWLALSCSSDLTNQMVPKGAIAVDGVSLTLVDVSPGRFRVMLIPHTLERTTLGFRAIGDAVNVEVDILGKYVFQAIQSMQSKS
jgi:riboflavin synthase